MLQHKHRNNAKQRYPNHLRSSDSDNNNNIIFFIWKTLAKLGVLIWDLDHTLILKTQYIKEYFCSACPHSCLSTANNIWYVILSMKVANPFVIVPITPIIKGITSVWTRCSMFIVLAQSRYLSNFSSSLLIITMTRTVVLEFRCSVNFKFPKDPNTILRHNDNFQCILVQLI